MTNNRELFLTFIKSSQKQMCDLDFLKAPEEWLKPLLGEKALKFFRIFFRNKAGDLIGEWDINGVFKKGETFPVVWLSSEGSPNTVVAKNFNEFLSVLPFGGDIITGLPVLIQQHRAKPKIVVSPEKKFTEQYIKKAFEYQASMFNGHSDLVKFISETLGVQLNYSPVQTIRETVDTFPDLDLWIDKNLK